MVSAAPVAMTVPVRPLHRQPEFGRKKTGRPTLDPSVVDIVESTAELRYQPLPGEPGLSPAIGAMITSLEAPAGFSPPKIHQTRSPIRRTLTHESVGFESVHPLRSAPPSSRQPVSGIVA